MLIEACQNSQTNQNWYKIFAYLVTFITTFPNTYPVRIY